MTDRSGYLYALDADTGNRAFEHLIQRKKSIPGVAAANMNRSPIVSGDFVVYPAPDGRLFSVDTSGRGGTERQLHQFKHRVAAPPAAVNGAVFVNAPPKLYGLTL